MELLSQKQFRQALDSFQKGDWVKLKSPHPDWYFGQVLRERPRGGRTWYIVRFIEAPLEETYGLPNPFNDRNVPEGQLKGYSPTPVQEKAFHKIFDQWQTWDRFGRPDSPVGQRMPGRMVLFDQPQKYWGKPVSEYFK